MKFVAAVACLASAVAALPAEALVPRQSNVAVTDQLMFGITLPAFSTRRANRDPPTLDWTTDGCTSSPDNPFGFPFLPACHRHDFGYHNFRAQTRFTQSNKLRIDDNFKADLYFQCQGSSVKFVCEGLAEVYYAAVRAFGGGDATPGKRDDDLAEIYDADLVHEYEEKVAIYEELVKEAQEAGLLPTL